MDALVWLEFLENFNGDCYMQDMHWDTHQALEPFTDSTGNSSLGCGAYYKGHWIQFRWPSHWENINILTAITLSELYPVILALLIWGHLFTNKKILLRIDNQALVSIVNKRTSKSKRVMTLVRKLISITMKSNFQLKALHVPGSCNEIADALSRFQQDRFLALESLADPVENF